MGKRNNVKLIIIGGATIITSLIATIIILNQVNTKKTPKEETTNITKEQNINNIVFTNIECDFDGTYSLLTYKIINKTNETIKLEDYEIIIKDKEDNILANIAPSITKELQSNEEVETGNAIDENICNAHKLELKIN